MLLLNYIDRFGVQAVMGRSTLGAGEIRRMIASDNIVHAYESRKRADNWATWASANPTQSRILNDAIRLAEDTDNGE